MAYLAAHGDKREFPAALVPGTVSVISVRMDYLATGSPPGRELLDHPRTGYIARYALGRDYHRVLRQRLRRLARRLEQEIGDFGYRVFADSAPILEKALARDASLGWIGKNTLLIDPQRGSYFFLGEIYTDLPLPPSKLPPVADHCGGCQACIRACPTNAIGPQGGLDARRCISYLTIELRGSIPLALRSLIGNRIFGCDDCQIFCPWNRYARPAVTADFAVRHNLDAAPLTSLFFWTEQEFLERTEGMALRRTGYEGWLRNIAVALGNAPTSPAVLEALGARAEHGSAVVREHVAWALAQHQTRSAS